MRQTSSHSVFRTGCTERRKEATRLIFASFGLLAPRNATTVGVLLLSALSVAASMFLILELADPFDGLIKVSSAPLRYAMAHLGQ